MSKRNQEKLGQIYSHRKLLIYGNSFDITFRQMGDAPKLVSLKIVQFMSTFRSKCEFLLKLKIRVFQCLLCYPPRSISRLSRTFQIPKDSLRTPFLNMLWSNFLILCFFHCQTQKEECYTVEQTRNTKANMFW